MSFAKKILLRRRGGNNSVDLSLFALLVIQTLRKNKFNDFAYANCGGL